MDFETKNAVERLRLGGADQRDRDRVLCYLADSRWTDDQLDRKIESRHNALCSQCPIKIEHSAVGGNAQRGKYERVLFWLVVTLVGILSAVITGGHIKPLGG